MATPIRMPKLGMSMEQGRIVAWQVEPSGRVEKGDLLVVIESEKAENEIEATVSGYLRHIYISAGPDPIPCGSLLAAIAQSADEPFDAEAFRAEHDRAGAARNVAAATTPTAGARDRGRRPRAAITPAARGLARKLGIDPAALQGSGPGGRIVREDVEAVAERRKRLLQVAKGVSLEVRVEGHGEPLLLLPGFGCDVSIFAQQTAMLIERHRVLAVNPRGIGLSDAPEVSAYEVATLASDVAALIEAPTHVVGASLGAAVALELALHRPEKVRSLVLITPFLEATPRLLAVLDAWCRVAPAGGDALAAMLLPWLFSDDLLGDDARLRVVRRGLADAAGRVAPATLERTAAGLRSWSGARSGEIAELAAPTLVVAGAADLLVPEAADLARRIPAADCEIVPRCGHAVSIEAPEALNTALARHLAAQA